MFRVFRVCRVFGCLGLMVGCLGWVGCRVLFWVWPDKKVPKCNMGFDSDTFTKKMFKTAEKLKLGQNEEKSKMVFGRITKIYPPKFIALWSSTQRSCIQLSNFAGTRVGIGGMTPLTRDGMCATA